MTTGVVVVRVAIHVDPRDAHVDAISDTVPSIIGGIPIRMRSIQVNIDRAQLHDQPDQLLPVQRRLAGDRRPGHGGRLLLLLPADRLRDASLQAKDDRSPNGRQKATARSKNPALRFDLRTRPGDANIKSLVGHPAEVLRDRPTPSREHLLEGAAGSRTMRRSPADRHWQPPTHRFSTSRCRAPRMPSRASASCHMSSSSWAAR